MEDGLIENKTFDMYGRYAPIRDIINFNRVNKKKFKVLDVGGRGNILKDFLPDDDIFYLDPNIDSTDDNFIKGDGCKMPLGNESFDYVVSADVFEHIPEKLRTNFLDENLRVAKLGVIISAPFWSKEAAQAEVEVNEVFKTYSKGAEHPWLVEHIDNGLPKEKLVLDYIKSKKISCQKINNNYLPFWELLVSTSFIYGVNPTMEIEEKSNKLNAYYNKNIFPIDHAEPSYRKIFFIKKKDGQKDLPLHSASIDSQDTLALVRMVNQLVAKSYRNRVDEFESEVLIRDRRLKDFQSEINRLNAANDELNKRISRYENFLPVRVANKARKIFSKFSGRKK